MNEPPGHSPIDKSTLRRRWGEIDLLFDEMLGYPTGERDEALHRACRDDPELRELVLALLHSAASTPAQLKGPDRELLAAALDLQMGPGPGPGLKSGDIVGRYRVLGELGSGGMATVYEAERSDGAYEQVVALKVLRRGLDTDRIVERFRAERQILSDFAHPNVARLLDGGTAPDGRPYLVMERVQGEPITAWAERHDVDIRARLELFLQVTDAVAEAHRHLVVHRDIKPANILVDASGRVKLLDFGIAKLLSSDAGSDLTEPGPSPLTRRYASPEQRRGEPITTASDVYQLGLLLHQILTKEWPFDRDNGGLRTHLEGDLDVIVRTALAPDADDRYVTVEALATDIRRHLEGRPIEARPIPWWLRASKWTRRNRWAPPVAALLVLGVTAYLATLYVGLDRVARERDAARTQAARAERIQQVMVDLFQSVDPFETPDATRPDLTVAEALAPAVDRIRRDLSDDPLAQADLLAAVASVHHSLQRPDDGLPLIREALEIRRRSEAERSPEFAADLLTLASMMREEDWDSAAVLVQDAVVILRESAPPDDPRLAQALSEQMWLQVTRLPPADPALGEEALSIYRAAGDRYRTEAAGVLSHLSYVYSDAGRLDEAEAAIRSALALHRETATENAALSALAAVRLAGVLDTRQRYDEAIPLYREAIEVLEKTAGPDHGQTLTTKNNLATTYKQAGRPEEAVELLREIIASRIREAGSELDLEVGQGMQNLAAALVDLGELQSADSLAARAHEIFVATTSEGHPLRAFPLLTRSEILLQLEEPGRAAAIMEEALPILEGALPAGHYAIGVARCRLGAAWVRMGRVRDGETELAQGLEILERDERTPPEYVAECGQEGRIPG